MPALACSPTANQLAASALFASGKSTRQVAEALGFSQKTAWRLRHAELHDPELIHHCSKTVADRMVLTASAAVDTVLDRAVNGELAKEKSKDLMKMASMALESATLYAAASGSKDMLSGLIQDLDLQQSHKVTLENKVTIERTTPQPVDITPRENP